MRNLAFFEKEKQQQKYRQEKERVHYNFLSIPQYGKFKILTKINTCSNFPRPETDGRTKMCLQVGFKHHIYFA